MAPNTKGQDYAAQCPLCDMPLYWSLLDSGRHRIAKARNQHESGCPAAVLDPRKLQSMTVADVDAELAGLRRRATPPSGTESS